MAADVAVMSVDVVRPAVASSQVHVAVTPAPWTLATKASAAVHTAWDFVSDNYYRLLVPTVAVYCAGAALQLTQAVADIDPENPAVIAALVTGVAATGLYAVKSLVADPRPPHPPKPHRREPVCADP